ncbi:MAG: lipoyl(octanoyl) transferase LipB [Bacteroidetes bacterium]|nr:lipoyl(octanoyl) transferase LipB [Bacteroidota bacterium]
MKPHVRFHSWGRRAFEPVWREQEAMMKAIIDQKIRRRNAGLEGWSEDPANGLSIPENHLIFVEHSHVLTLGKSGDKANVIASPEWLKEQGVEYYPINRGGDITYHGPGQLVGYPILDLEQFFTDIGKYMRCLEEAIIRTCSDYGLNASRIEGLTGVWLDAENGAQARKIAALGVKCSRWVTMHGFAFNVNTDLEFFELIIPCGIQGRGVTSLAKELGYEVDILDVEQKLKDHLQMIFGWEWVED